MEIATLVEAQEPRIQSLARADAILSVVMNNRAATPLLVECDTTPAVVYRAH